MVNLVNRRGWTSRRPYPNTQLGFIPAVDVLYEQLLKLLEPGGDHLHPFRELFSEEPFEVLFVLLR